MITVEHLTKCYGDFVAVDDLSFEIGEGHVYGFLGPNGAGKSTTMNIMTGCLSATAGHVRIDGHDIFDEPNQAKALIGYLPEQPPLYMNETPTEYLRFVGEAKGLRGEELTRQIESVMEQTKIQDMRNRCINALSKGYKQRVGIAQALLGDPPFLIFDEPTVGLDPEERIHFRNLFSRTAQDRLVLLSTHIIEDVQSVCDRLVVINHGQIRFTGTPEQLIASAAGHVGVFWEKDETQEQGLHITARVNTSQGVRCRAVADQLPPYAQAEEPTLEDAYLYLISREAAQ